MTCMTRDVAWRELEVRTCARRAGTVHAIYIYIHIYSASIVIVMRAALRTRISWYLSTRKADHRHYSIYLSTFYTPLMHDTIIISKAWCNANLRSVSGKPCGYILYYWQTHKEKPIQLYIYIYIGFVKNNNVRE